MALAVKFEIFFSGNITWPGNVEYYNLSSVWWRSVVEVMGTV
jgi:hypothetical protein